MIVTMTSEEIDAIMTPERIREEEERMENTPFVYDEDCPPLTEEMIKARNFHRAGKKTS
ncbi:hypothetical protein [Anaerovibrio sp. RM50]|uniref:hypothetical protein n=1 Tax=Anaerovibrio sp. RM50 TaxID=1200557 RepID=UPI000AB24007|nr:hypothetical protein [Anaerovibrio sp. RM50]